MPVVGQYKAKLPFKYGDNSFIFSLFIISKFLTPFVSPCSFICINFSLSSSVNPTTSFPVLLKGISSSSATLSKFSFPSTQNFAIKEPGLLLNPACNTPEFLPLVSLHTSNSFSNTHTFNTYLDSSLAIELPITPPPIIAISYILFNFFTPF